MTTRWIIGLASGSSADSVDAALSMLRSGNGADLLMVDTAIDIHDLALRLEAERIPVPIVACGTHNDAQAGIAAIRAGAREYVPLPPDPELIAAVLAAVADDSHHLVYEDESMAAVIALAEDGNVVHTSEAEKSLIDTIAWKKTFRNMRR